MPLATRVATRIEIHVTLVSMGKIRTPHLRIKYKDYSYSNDYQSTKVPVREINNETKLQHTVVTNTQ